MGDYTYSEIMKMQNDAIKRVEEMQKKARKAVGIKEEQKEREKRVPVDVQEPKRIPMPNDYLEQLKELTHKTDDKTQEKAETREPENKKEKPFSNKGNNSFSNIQLDDDKALLLALIMLLSEEGADEVLIMALIYMLT